MPTNRRRIGRKAHELKEHEVAFLRDDPQSLPGWGGYSLWNLRTGNAGLDGDRDPADLWRQHAAEFLPEFIRKNPGRRPVAWWLFDAPRQPDRGSGWYYEGTLPEPRRLLGGKGSTPWDAGIAVVPCFSCALPCAWEGYDPTDPPTFESQAAFLQRHGLLTDPEKRALAKLPAAWEPEVVRFDDVPDSN
jgi:hypothetical protein